MMRAIRRLAPVFQRSFQPSFRTFSSKKDPPEKPSKAPDNFYDEEVEAEKEFLDMTTALFEDGKLDNLTLLRSPITWQAIDDLAEPVDLQALMQETTEELDRTSEEELDRIEKEMAPKLDSAAVKGVLDAIGHPDLGNHLSSFEESYIPEEYINYTIPWKDHDGIEDPKLDKFVPSTAPERFSYSNQGERACKGKLQRRGKEGKLGCHLIDLDDLSYLDTVNLKRFLSDDAEILGKTHTGLCSKCQRKVAKCIKTARQMGLLPHIGQFFVEDSRPTHVDKNFHDVVKTAQAGRVESRTIF